MPAFMIDKVLTSQRERGISIATDENAMVLSRPNDGSVEQFAIPSVRAMFLAQGRSQPILQTPVGIPPWQVFVTDCRVLFWHPYIMDRRGILTKQKRGSATAGQMRYEWLGALGGTVGANETSFGANFARPWNSATVVEMIDISGQHQQVAPILTALANRLEAFLQAKAIPVDDAKNSPSRLLDVANGEVNGDYEVDLRKLGYQPGPVPQD